MGKNKKPVDKQVGVGYNIGGERYLKANQVRPLSPKLLAKEIAIALDVNQVRYF
ncbi:MAG: hypothetical protein LUC38_09070 [Oscillospiraceae bacterium]|nr:hypothetical protein [Ruminococcus sp.]MCD8346082.1 hypothetical protein [Oscillospiraceae bacterium]